MANKRGNPDIYKYGFKSDRNESYTATISLRIPPSLKEQLKDVDNWQQLVRDTLQKAAIAKTRY